MKVRSFQLAAVAALALCPVEADQVWAELNATHFWDCNGGGCDAATLSPWDESKYVYAPYYAPLNPQDFGGAAYGENLWLTGAASDALSDLLGDDSSCCGSDPAKPGGCGRCLLVQNPSALMSNWTAVVMKKSRCPPESPGCELPHIHMDIAVPGFDNLTVSLSNVCGKSSRDITFLTREQSGICAGATSLPGGAAQNCKCDSITGDSREMNRLRSGCSLFAAWGWTSGNPKLQYRRVDCPNAFANLVQKSFAATGVAVPPKPKYWLWVLLVIVGVLLLAMFALLVLRAVQQRHQAKKKAAHRLVKQGRHRPSKGHHEVTDSESE